MVIKSRVDSFPAGDLLNNSLVTDSSTCYSPPLTSSSLRNAQQRFYNSAIPNAGLLLAARDDTESFVGAFRPVAHLRLDSGREQGEARHPRQRLGRVQPRSVSVGVCDVAGRRRLLARDTDVPQQSRQEPLRWYVTPELHICPRLLLTCISQRRLPQLLLLLHSVPCVDVCRHARVPLRDRARSRHQAHQLLPRMGGECW